MSEEQGTVVGVQLMGGEPFLCVLCMAVPCRFAIGRASLYCHANVAQLWSSLSETSGVAFLWQYVACLSRAKVHQAVTDPRFPPILLPHQLLPNVTVVPVCIDELSKLKLQSPHCPVRFQRCDQDLTRHRGGSGHSFRRMHCAPNPKLYAGDLP